MILSKFNQYDRLGFIVDLFSQSVGLQLQDEKFRYFQNRYYFYNNEGIEIKEFNVNTVKDFRLQFNYKLYWVFYDTY